MPKPNTIGLFDIMGRLILTLEGILGLALSKEEDLQKLDLETLQKLTSALQD